VLADLSQALATYATDHRYSTTLSQVEGVAWSFRPGKSRNRLLDLVMELRDVFDALAEKKRLALSVERAAGLIANIDGGRFKQVLYNYLSNAVKFTRDAGIGGCIPYRPLTRTGTFDWRCVDT